MIRAVIILSITFGSLTYGQVSSEILGSALNNIDIEHIENLNKEAKQLIVNQQVDIALPVLYESLKRSLSIRYQDGIGEAYHRIGYAYTITDRYDSAVSYLKRAIPFCEMSSTKRYILVDLYTCLAYVAFQEGKYDQALIYFDQSILEQKRTNVPGSKRVLATTLNNISSIHFVLQQYDRALHFSGLAERVCKEEGYHEVLASVLGSRATIYLNLNQLDKAEQLYLACIEIAKGGKTHNDALAWLTAKLNLALLKIEQRKTEEALALIIESEQYEVEFRNHITTLGPDYVRGKAYLQLAKYKEAERSLMASMKQNLDMGNVQRLAATHQLLATVYDSSGNYKKALEHHYAYTTLKDSMLEKERIKGINEIDAKYRIAEKDRQLAIAQKAASEKNMWIAIASASVLLVSGVAFNFYRRVRQKRKILGQQEEIERLKNMMKGEERERERIAEELHDGIGSMLAALKMNISNLSLDAATDPSQRNAIHETLLLAEETAREVRRTSHNLIPKMLEMHNLEEALALYCDNISRTTGVHFSLQVNGAADTLSKAAELLLYRIVQELSQNIIKHAQATRAYVQISVYEQTLSLVVEDNGTGMDSEQLCGGIGLKNLQYRVAALEGTMTIDSVKGRNTVVVIELNRNKLEVLT